MSQMCLGQVQPTAVALIGLQSPEMLEIEIQLQKNGYKQNANAIVEANEANKKKEDSTIAYGKSEKSQFVKQSIGGMLGSGLAMVASGASIAGGIYSATEVNSTETQLGNLDKLEGGLQQPRVADDIALANPALEGSDDFSDLSTLFKEPETPFRDDFLSKPLNEKRALFNNKLGDPNYFENNALEFSDVDQVAAQNNIDELRQSLKANQDFAKKIGGAFQAMPELGRASQGFSDSLGNFYASREKIAQAMDQINQQSADFAMQFAKSMQETMSQSIQTAQQMANQIIQNEQTISASGRV